MPKTIQNQNLNLPNSASTPLLGEKATENLRVRDKKLLGDKKEYDEAMIEIYRLEKATEEYLKCK